MVWAKWFWRKRFKFENLQMRMDEVITIVHMTLQVWWANKKQISLYKFYNGSNDFDELIFHQSSSSLLPSSFLPRIVLFVFAYPRIPVFFSLATLGGSIKSPL
jgi:hypothetical protein